MEHIITENEGCKTGIATLRDKIGQPIETDGLMLMVCERGTASLMADFKTITLRPGRLLVLIYGISLIPLKASEDFSTRFLSVPSQYADTLFYQITSSSFWEYQYRHPVYMLAEETQRQLQMWFSQLEWGMNQLEGAAFSQAMSNHLHNLMLVLMSDIEKHADTDKHKNISKDQGWKLCYQFYILLYRYYAAHHDVKFYADRLCITPDYLYKVHSRLFGTSPKEMIDRQLIISIKTYLNYTDLSLKAIATRLNFEDPSYLCRFFRRQTGLSPIEYRKR